MTEIKNIYSLPGGNSDDQEIFETLFQNNNLLIERIVTQKPYNSPGEWYDQENDEWVLLVQGQAELEFKNGDIKKLYSGDYIFIPSHKIHRIKRSGSDKNCIWLAIHTNHK